MIKKTRYRLLSGLLALTMVFSTFSATALTVKAEDNYSDEQITVETAPEEQPQSQEVSKESTEFPDTAVTGESSGEGTEIASGTCGENLTWVITNDGTLTIRGNGAMDNYGGSGSPWHSLRSEITSVVIEEGVSRIGSCAFYYADALTEIYLPSTLKIIGARAFMGCHLQNVYIADLESWCNTQLVSREANPMMYANNVYVRAC